MLFSAVVLSYNSSRTLQRCLNDLKGSFAHFDKPSEIIVVHNGSVDDSEQIIDHFEKENPTLCHKITFDYNSGTTVSRNAALKKASGDYILIIDSDAYMNKETLIELKRVLDENKQIGMAVPQLRYADGRYQMSTDRFPTLYRKLQRFLSLDKMQLAAENESDLKARKYVDYAISACWLLKKEVVKKAGYFDEKIFYSPEDVDYCLNIWHTGYKICYVPSVSMIHDAQELSRGFKLSIFHFSHLKGLFYLFFKYRYFWGLSNLYKKINR